MIHPDWIFMFIIILGAGILVWRTIHWLKSDLDDKHDRG
jgi:hypothetical protein